MRRDFHMRGISKSTGLASGYDEVLVTERLGVSTLDAEGDKPWTQYGLASPAPALWGAHMRRPSNWLRERASRQSGAAPGLRGSRAIMASIVRSRSRTS